jgi:hypothetical protein
VPGFIAALVEILHFAEDLEFLRQHLGPLLVVAKQLLPFSTTGFARSTLRNGGIH